MIGKAIFTLSIITLVISEEQGLNKKVTDTWDKNILFGHDLGEGRHTVTTLFHENSKHLKFEIDTFNEDSCTTKYINYTVAEHIANLEEGIQILEEDMLNISNIRRSLPVLSFVPLGKIGEAWARKEIDSILNTAIGSYLKVIYKQKQKKSAFIAKYGSN